MRLAAALLLTVVLTLSGLDWALFRVGGLERRLVPTDPEAARTKLLMASRHRDARVLYVGDSRVATDIDPDTVTAVCGCGPGYNAGFGAADPRLMHLMLRRLLVNVSPVIVVVGVSQWSLSDAADIAVYGPARDLLAPWEFVRVVGFTGPAELTSVTLGKLWTAYRYRQELRATVMAAVGEPTIPFRRGFVPRTESLAVARVVRDVPGVWRRGFEHFDVRGRRASALRAVLDDARARGLQVMLLAPPLHPASRRILEPELRAFRSMLREIGAASGVVTEDLTDPGWLSVGDFADNVHLNEGGALKFSRHLGERLRTLSEAR